MDFGEKMEAKYKRILIKASGQALGKGRNGDGISNAAAASFCKRTFALQKLNVQMGIVVGGGNLFRGRDALDAGFLFDKIEADYIGMTATIFNSLVLKNTYISLGADAVVMSAIPLHPVAEPINHNLARKYLNEGKIVVFAGGTGNPMCSTDSASALRAAEVNADVLIKATRVDGVYSSDPEKNKNAKKFDRLTYDEVLSKNLRVMDSEAFALCRDQNIPIVILNIDAPKSLERFIIGEKVGSLISGSK